MARGGMLPFGAGLAVGLGILALASLFGEGSPKSGRTEPGAPLRRVRRVRRTKTAAPMDGLQPRVRLSPAAQEAFFQPESLHFRDQEGSARGYLALAALAALAGREEDALWAAQRALDAGCETEYVQEAVGWLPPPGRAQVFEDLMSRYPNAAWGVPLVAAANLEAGRKERAVELFRGAFAAAGDATVRMGLARDWIEIDPESAARELPALMKRRDGDADGFLQLATVLIGKGKSPLAKPFLDKALDLEAGDPGAIRLLASVDPAAARAAAEAVLESDPDDPAAWDLVAEIRKSTGDPSGAFEAYREAAARKPSKQRLQTLYRLDPRRALPLMVEMVRNSRDDEAIGIVAHGLERSGDAEGALETYFRAHAIDATDAEWLRGMVRIDPARAAKVLGRQIAGSSRKVSDEILGAHANALLAVGEKQAAFDEYRRALAKDPNDEEWMEGLADADPEQAIPLLRDHLARAPGKTERIGALGLALAASGRLREGIELLDRAIKIGSADHWLVVLARFSPQEGLARLQARVEEAPVDDERWGALGKAYLALGRRKAARRALRKALELDATDSEWRNMLAELRLR